jgi:ADP-ribose pyrophosphatase
LSWRQRKTEKVFETKYFNVSVDECQTDSGKTVPRYYVVDFPDWVQAVALTKNGELIVVDQYRYPGKNTFLEFAGGSTDPNRQEDPLQAAQRELREETGYTSNDWLFLGSHFANPALQTNRIHTYMARNCEKTHDLDLDPFEELTVKLVKAKDFIEHSRNQKEPHHSLMLSSLFLALPYL